MTFTKKPLKTKTKPNMKNYIIALIATLIIVGGVMYHRDTVDALQEPTRLESLIIKKGHYKIERTENRKIIEELELRNEELRKEEYEMDKEIGEITGVNFQ